MPFRTLNNAKDIDAIFSFSYEDLTILYEACLDIDKIFENEGYLATINRTWPSHIKKLIQIYLEGSAFRKMALLYA